MQQDNYKEKATPKTQARCIMTQIIAGMQHNTINNAASYKLPPPDHKRHAHKSGSIQACLANAILKEDATKQVASGNTVNTSSSTALQHPPAKDNITVDKEMYLQPKKINSDCSIS